MNKKEYLMIVLAEECMEVIDDYMDGNEYIYEAIDVIAIFDLLNEKFPKFPNLNKEEILDEKEFLKRVRRLHYITMKSLRFGLFHSPSNIERKNIEILIEESLKIKNYILINHISSLDSFNEMRNLKKEKVLNFYQDKINYKKRKLRK